MMSSGCEKVCPALRPVLDEQAPLEHHILGNLEQALGEHRAQLVRQPVIELGAADRIADRFDAVTDLGEFHLADEQLLQRLSGDKRAHPRIGVRPA